jgi:ketosteroid isomerase-like protein
MFARRLVPLLALALACSPKYLKGTEIRDTPDTRAIANALEAYREAMEKRDPQAIMALVAPDYFDKAGTTDPADDVDRAGLEKRLQDLSDVTALRLQLTIRDIQAKGDEGQAEVFFDQYYRVTTPNGPVARHDADVHRMTLKRIKGEWKFARDRKSVV